MRPKRGRVPFVTVPYAGDRSLLDRADPALRGWCKAARPLCAIAHAAGCALRRHWDTAAPVHAEHDAGAGADGGGRGRFLAAYTRDYLEHPQRCDSFRRAAVELLSCSIAASANRDRARQLQPPARQIPR
jgi:hypothetical protein